MLVLLAEPRLCELCEALAAQSQNPVRGFAALAPSLVPTLVDRDRYEARLLDPAQDIQARMAALSILASVGADLGALYERLRTAETSSEHLELWDFLFLQEARRAPFAAAIPLLEARLRSPDVDGADVFGGALASLGRLPGPEATGMLLRAISHPNRPLRLAAVMTLRDRRSKAALAGLVQRLGAEEELPISAGLVTAIVASGARSVGDLAAPARESEALSLWRCVLAARTRDAAFAPRLLALANDASANWQLRRAAINTAGFLPFEAALAHMLPILRERSPLTADGHQDLGAHSFLCWLLLFDAPGLLPAFTDGRARFVALVEDILDGVWGSLNDPRGLPSRTEAAGWLHDRLRTHGWPENPRAPDAVVNELHIPLLHSAILRALRRAGRVDLIEAELAHADHVWTATKCLLECVRAGRGGPGAADRLPGLVARSPVSSDERIARIVDGLAQSGRKAPSAAAPAEVVAPAPLGTLLGYEEAVLALTGGGPDPDLKAQAPVVLGTLTPEQFEHLARLADPINDRHAVAERYVPEVTLGREGHSVARRQQTYSNPSEPSGAWIRPALAAANRLDLPIPWHKEILSGPLASIYAERLLACLAATGDAEAYCAILYRDPDLLLPHLCSDATRRSRAALIDHRMVPFLAMNVSSGTDEVFAGLCELARAVSSPAIDGVLSGLFQRWTGHFKGWRTTGPRQTSHHIWRAFGDLTGHPRFDHIEGWQRLLSPVLYAPLAWYHKQHVARVLERDPGAYIQLESLLSKSEDWAHYYEDEIDRLEQAAERLFGQVRDCAHSGQRPPPAREAARIVLAPLRRLWSSFLAGVRSRRYPHNE